MLDLVGDLEVRSVHQMRIVNILHIVHFANIVHVFHLSGGRIWPLPKISNSIRSCTKRHAPVPMRGRKFRTTPGASARLVASRGDLRFEVMCPPDFSGTFSARRLVHSGRKGTVAPNMRCSPVILWERCEMNGMAAWILGIPALAVVLLHVLLFFSGVL
ncbi:hypothetical protein [Paenirhodobacter populi]|uniref:hypothetical protein n=1 Tax=Paenirhodobacter populi TaxID=2306993 RepID=UPI000FE2D714|nr:hypothetical protein [Sinirhodobacter populi]RWR07714.1 hypothetical protein D2T32_11595 [Sinirhodobacter populi]